MTMRILVLDNVPTRLAEIVLALGNAKDVVIDARQSIERAQFECGSFDLILVHQGNDEAVPIEEPEWHRGRAALIVFSGGFAPDRERYSDILYVSARYLLKNVVAIVQEGVG